MYSDTQYTSGSGYFAAEDESSKTSVKWLEIPIQKFNSAVPQFVEKIKGINNSISKLKRLEQWDEIQRQQSAALSTVNQLSTMVKEMDTLRNQVVESDLPKFDKQIRSSKQSALAVIKSCRIQDVSNFSSSSYKYEADDEQCERAHEQLQIIADLSEKVKDQERRAAEMERIEADIEDVNTIFKDLSQMVNEQGEQVDRIEENIETTEINVSQGEKMLCQAVKYKNGMYPMMGALIGSVVGGPIGLMAGFKLGSLTAVGCGVLGFTGGKFLKNQNESHIKEADERRASAQIL